MYYEVTEEGISPINQKDWEKSDSGIAVFDNESFAKELKLRTDFLLETHPDDIFFCRTEHHARYLLATFHIPIKKKEKRYQGFWMYVLSGKLIFVDDESIVKEMIQKVTERITGNDYCMDKFLYEFLMLFIEEDTIYLAEIERDIAEMEEDVLRKNTENFNYRMLGMKKEISRFYCYYGQMINMGEALMENAINFWGTEETDGYELFVERTTRLQQQVQVLREYAMQVQDVYQAEIEIHQNNIMKVLTVVTTIFLPLTLIAGWYGMNFEYMPELKWEYSYPVVVGVSLLIVAVSLYYFKKKKYF